MTEVIHSCWREQATVLAVGPNNNEVAMYGNLVDYCAINATILKDIIYMEVPKGYFKCDHPLEQNDDVVGTSVHYDKVNRRYVNIDLLRDGSCRWRPYVE